MRVLHTEEPHGPEATPEEIVRKLRQGEQLIAEGKSIADVVKALGISDHTYSRWRNQYGGLKADDTKELLRQRYGRNACSADSLPADELEQAILDQLADLLSREDEHPPRDPKTPSPNSTPTSPSSKPSSNA